MAEEKCAPLFETKRAKGRLFYKVFSLSLFVGICFIWVFRVSHIPREDGKWGWIGLLCAELWFGLYWLLRHPFRWNPLFREPFRHRLSQRYHALILSLSSFIHSLTSSAPFFTSLLSKQIQTSWHECMILKQIWEGVTKGGHLCVYSRSRNWTSSDGY